LVVERFVHSRFFNALALIDVSFHAAERAFLQFPHTFTIALLPLEFATNNGMVAPREVSARRVTKSPRAFGRKRP
jgi:hypothetical protein